MLLVVCMKCFVDRCEEYKFIGYVAACFPGMHMTFIVGESRNLSCYLVERTLFSCWLVLSGLTGMGPEMSPDELVTVSVGRCRWNTTTSPRWMIRILAIDVDIFSLLFLR